MAGATQPLHHPCLMNHNNAHTAHAADDDVANMKWMMMKMAVEEDAGDEDDNNEDNDEFKTRTSMTERLKAN